MIDIDIVNVVGMINYNRELDLVELAATYSQREEINSVKYDPRNANWLQARFAPDDTYVAIYRSGGCSVAGVKSPDNFYEVADRVTKLMDDILKEDVSPDSEIKNIVVTTDLQENIPLDLLALNLGLEDTEYEPEQFPALIHRNQNHAILVFPSGKILCTGLNSIERITEVLEEFTQLIRNII